MLTLWCVLVAVGSLYFIGLPLAALLFSSEDDAPSLWIVAPFIGLSVIVLGLQNLVYLDVRIGVSTPWLWAGACLLWAWLARAGRLPSVFSAVPRLPLTMAFLVYVVQGLGLLLAGAKYYVGRAWHDQFNYTALAQFLVDYPYSLSFGDIRHQPYLFKAIAIKSDRIGQAVLHGFLATSSFTDAKTTFEPTILLAPPLIALAVYVLARRLSLAAQLSLLVAVSAGTLPAIALIHLESFLSNALAIPLLLIWPLFVSALLDRPTWRRLLIAALLLAAGASIYAEFYVLFLGVAALMVGFQAIRRPKTLVASLASYILLAATGVLLNAGSLHAILNITRRIAVPNVLPEIYPWAYSPEGIDRIWLGDIVARFPPGVQDGIAIASMCLIVTAYLGLWLAFSADRTALRLALLALAALPALLAVRGRPYEYQFYKLLLSVSPLLPLGIGAAAARAAASVPCFKAPRGRNAVCTLGVALCCVCCAATIDMTLRTGTGSTLEQIGRGGAHKLLSPATKQIQDTLTKLRGQEIYILWRDEFYGGAYVNAWLAYFARHNRVWIGNPLLSDINVEHWAQANRDLQGLPAPAFVLTPSVLGSRLTGRSVKQVLSADPYSLWGVTGDHWALLVDVANPDAAQWAHGRACVSVGPRDTVLTVVAGSEGMLTLGAEVAPGPGEPEMNVRHMLVRTDAGFTSESTLTLPWNPADGLPVALAIPIPNGRTHIAIRALDEPTMTRLPSEGRRPVAVALPGLCLRDLR